MKARRQDLVPLSSEAWGEGEGKQRVEGTEYQAKMLDPAGPEHRASREGICLRPAMCLGKPAEVEAGSKLEGH